MIFVTSIGVLFILRLLNVRSGPPSVRLTTASCQGPDLPQAPRQEAALALVFSQRQRALVTGGRFRERSLPPQHIRARGVQQVVLIQLAVGGNSVEKWERPGRA